MSRSGRDGRVAIGVVDHGAGNLVSIHHALERVGAQVTICRRAADLDGRAAIVVPGVGASGPAMERLRRRGLDAALVDRVAAGVPYLGICLGLQLLFERSDEDGAQTLGLLAGTTVRLAAPRLPHIGWNTVHGDRPHPLVEGIPDGSAFYFVHSYAAAPTDPRVVLAETDHGARFVSVVAAGSILGTQFHPERSGTAGLRLLSNFLGLVRAQPAEAAA